MRVAKNNRIKKEVINEAKGVLSVLLT